MRNTVVSANPLFVVLVIVLALDFCVASYNVVQAYRDLDALTIFGRNQILTIEARGALREQSLLLGAIVAGVISAILGLSTPEGVTVLTISRLVRIMGAVLIGLVCISRLRRRVAIRRILSTPQQTSE